MIDSTQNNDRREEHRGRKSRRCVSQRNTTTRPGTSVVLQLLTKHDNFDRTVRSLMARQPDEWELIAIRTADEAPALKHYTAAADGQVRFLQCEEDAGIGPPLNLALQHARGEFVVFSECGDEFYPSFVADIARHGGEADMLVFRYDMVEEHEYGEARAEWDPAEHKSLLFAECISHPLAVVYRRELALRAGGFDERLWQDVHWELWKRLARRGAEFLFLPQKCGAHYIRRGEAERARPTPRQRGSSNRSGNGLVEIDVDATIKHGNGFVPHNNVLQEMQRESLTGYQIRDARDAAEAQFKGPIPRSAISPVDFE